MSDVRRSAVQGLVANNRGDRLAEHKKFFSRRESGVPRLENLEQVIEHIRPTGLLGLSTVGGSFTEDILRRMAQLNAKRT